MSRLSARSTGLSNVIVLFLALLSACTQSGGEGGESRLTLVSVNLSPNQSVPLNREFHLIFNRPVDLSTAGLDSIQFLPLAEAGGTEIPPVSGAFFQAGNSAEVTFQPFCPRSGDEAGGLLPGIQYQLRINGGEGASLLRGTDGSALAESITINFQTRDDSGPLFEDRIPGPPRITNADSLPDTLPLNLALRPIQLLQIRFDQHLDPASLDENAIRLEYADPDTLVPTRIPLEVLLTENCNEEGGAEVTVLPFGILPEGAAVDFLLSRMVSGLGDQDVNPEDTLFKRSLVATSPFDPQRDAVVEAFAEPIDLEASHQLLMPLATWGEGKLEPAPLFPPGFQPTELDIEIGKGTTNGKRVIFSTENGVLKDTNANPVFFADGVINVRNFTIQGGGEMIVEGSNPLRILASGTVIIGGKLNASGGDAPTVDGIGGGQQSPNGVGRAGGGDGGIGSPDAGASPRKQSVKGGDGNGPFNIPGAGGLGGHSAVQIRGTSPNRIADSIPGGGGAGNWGRKELIFDNGEWQWVTFCYSNNGCKKRECERPLNGCNMPCTGLTGPVPTTQGENGADGTICHNNNGATIYCNLEDPPDGNPGNDSQYDVCHLDALTGGCYSRGGTAGVGFFFDADDENNFWGRKSRGDLGVIVGELEEPMPGQGGGAGGDNLPNGFPNPDWVKQDKRGAGGGGGGGLVEIVAQGPIEVRGEINADGGNGGLGQNDIVGSNNTFSVTGGGGGGAGGIILLESRTQIKISKNGNIHARGGDRGPANGTLPGFTDDDSCYNKHKKRDEPPGAYNNKTSATGGAGGKGFVILLCPLDTGTSPVTCRGENRLPLQSGILSVNDGNGFQDIVCEEDFFTLDFDHVDPRPEIVLPRYGPESGIVSPWYYAGQAPGIRRAFPGTDPVTGELDIETEITLVEGSGVVGQGSASVSLQDPSLIQMVQSEPRILLGDSFRAEGGLAREIIQADLEEGVLTLYLDEDKGDLEAGIQSWVILRRPWKIFTGNEENRLPEGTRVFLSWEGTQETERGSMDPILPTVAAEHADLGDPAFTDMSFLRFRLRFDLGSLAPESALPQIRALKIQREF